MTETPKEELPVALVASDPPPSELTTRQMGQMQLITKHNLAQMISNAEALVDFYNAARKIALKATNPHDWTILGEKPYCLDSGVNKILQFLGASFKNIKSVTESETEVEIGRVDHYTTTGEFFFNGQTFSNIGMASTKDKFFAERTRKFTDPDGTFKEGDKYFLKFDEVDRANCKKKAVTNLKHRLLLTAFQFNPDIEELKNHFGDKFGKISTVSYGKGSKGGSTDSAATKNKRTELGNLILILVDGDTEKAGAKLQELSKFGEGEKAFKGYDDLKRVSIKMLDKTITRAKKEVEKKASEGMDKPNQGQAQLENAQKENSKRMRQPGED